MSLPNLPWHSLKFFSTFIFSDEEMNSSELTILALSAFFKKLQEIGYAIIPILASLKSEVSNLPNKANVTLANLAIR